jgi:hypothetical protein
MSEEKKRVPVDADYIADGDTFRVPFRRDGDKIRLVYDDGTFSDTWWTMPGTVKDRGFFWGVTVDESDIARAPVPREVVTLEYEVLPFSEMKAGDYHEAETGLHFIYHEDAVRLRRNLGLEHASKPPRVLRPIKKP